LEKYRTVSLFAFDTAHSVTRHVSTGLIVGSVPRRRVFALFSWFHLVYGFRLLDFPVFSTISEGQIFFLFCLSPRVIISPRVPQVFFLSLNRLNSTYVGAYVFAVIRLCFSFTGFFFVLPPSVFSLKKSFRAFTERAGPV